MSDTRRYIRRAGRATGRQPAFTLVELLVVVAIISLLVSILLPSLSKAKDLVRQVTCLTRVRGQIEAIHMYATEEDGAIPLGPADAHPWFHLPFNRIASNQIWMGQSRSYNAHGVLLKKHLTIPDAVFCPDDDSSDPLEELAKVRSRSGEDAYCSYLYRQLDGLAAGATGGRLGEMGLNAKGRPATALLLDMNSLMQMPGAPVRTNHYGRKVCVGFAEGHAGIFANTDASMTLRRGDEMRVLDRLDEIFEYADSLKP